MPVCTMTFRTFHTLSQRLVVHSAEETVAMLFGFIEPSAYGRKRMLTFCISLCKFSAHSVSLIR